MSTKVVTNPKTGMQETVPDYGRVTPEQVAETRRKLRDMLGGNTQFHEDDWDHMDEDTQVEKKEEKKDEAPSSTYLYRAA